MYGELGSTNGNNGYSSFNYPTQATITAYDSTVVDSTTFDLTPPTPSGIQDTSPNPGMDLPDTSVMCNNNINSGKPAPAECSGLGPGPPVSSSSVRGLGQQTGFNSLTGDVIVKAEPEQAAGQSTTTPTIASSGGGGTTVVAESPTPSSTVCNPPSSPIPSKPRFLSSSVTCCLHLSFIHY